MRLSETQKGDLFSSAWERKGVLKGFGRLEADLCPCVPECFGFSSDPDFLPL